MAFKRAKGKTKLVWRKKAASTVFAIDSLVYFNGTGEIIPADSTSGDHIGVIRKAIAATDSDYASETRVPVEVPLEKNVEWEADATGLTAAKEGTTMDLTDSVTVDGASTAKNVVTLVKYKSATKGKFVINALFDNYRVATT